MKFDFPSYRNGSRYLNDREDTRNLNNVVKFGRYRHSKEGTVNSTILTKVAEFSKHSGGIQEHPEQQ